MARAGTGRRCGVDAFPLFLSALALLVACAAAWSSWSRPDGNSEPVELAPTTREEQAELRQRLARVEAALGGTGPVTVEANTPRSELIDYQRIERFVLEVLSTRMAMRNEGGTAEVPVGEAASRAAWFAELATLGRGARADELWATIRAAGAVDEAVAWFERAAAAAPGSPDAQTMLGVAYIEQMLASNDEATRIEIGKRIDSQFSRALELAPDHWEARFRRAVGQSYGPALSGQRQQAIDNFERLVTQQANSPSATGHEQTYLYLGRLYAEQGNPARAAEVWRLGLQRHPGDPQLRQMLETTTAGR